MIPWRQARELVIQAARQVPPGAPELVPLAEAHGRVLAEPALVDRALPPFDRATRDGYALAAGDAGGPLECIGSIRAGEASGLRVRPGTCVRIFTGAAVPEGADCVAMQEDCARALDLVVVSKPPAPGDWIVPAGSEAQRGTVALHAGRRLGAAELALLASVGVAEPQCTPRPRVAILSTGDELVAVEQTPGPVQIRDANGPALAALVAAHGGQVVLQERVPDDRVRLEAALDRALAGCDLLLVSGGVSVGDHDLVEAALVSRGLTTHFDAVAIRPGKPAVCGSLGQTLFIGLPGNPISTIITFDLLASAALAVLAGSTPRLPLHSVRLAQPFAGKALPLTQFVPVALGEGGATAVAHHGSGDLFALASAHAWMVIEAGTTQLPAGSEVPCWPRQL